MQGVDGHEHHVAVFVGQFHDLLHPVVVILDAHKTSEHAHTVVDMDDIIAYVERTEVV